MKESGNANLFQLRKDILGHWLHGRRSGGDQDVFRRLGIRHGYEWTNQRQSGACHTLSRCVLVEPETLQFADEESAERKVRLMWRHRAYIDHWTQVANRLVLFEESVRLSDIVGIRVAVLRPEVDHFRATFVERYRPNGFVGRCDRRTNSAIVDGKQLAGDVHGRSGQQLLVLVEGQVSNLPGGHVQKRGGLECGKINEAHTEAGEQCLDGFL